jgi:hypothetical protein
MKHFLVRLADNIGMSRVWLRITAGVLTAGSALMFFLSRKEAEFPLTRMYIPDLQRQVTYIWQLLVVAGILILTAILTLVLSFFKKRA